MGQVFTEDEHGIVVFHLAQGWHRQRAVVQHLQNQAHLLKFSGFHTRVEVFGTDQFAQAVVAFQAGAWRADTDDVATTQHIGRLIEGGVQAQFLAIGEQRLAWAVFTVDVAIAEAATVAQEVLVNGTVETVLDTAQFAITLTGLMLQPLEQPWQMLGANCMSHLRL